MRLSQLLAEAWHSAWAAKVPTALVAILVAAMCATTGLTVGRAAAAQDQVMARMEGAGSRHLTVTDARNLGFMSSNTVAQAAQLSTVERAVGFGTTIDMVNTAIGPGGTPVPAFLVVGDLADTLDLTQGRWPEPGEALVSVAAQTALGLDAPVGAVSPTTAAATVVDYPIVGAFVAREPFLELDAGVVVAAPLKTVARRLDVIASDASAANVTVNATLLLLDRPNPADLTINSPQTLAQIQADVLGDLAQYNRGLVLLVLLGGGLLVAVVALADVLVRRTEIGRRRALGAPRWALIGILIIRSLIGGALGAIIGTAIAVFLVLRSGQVPDITFTAATAVLALVATAFATTLPAIIAAHQDPVRVLRTP